jgi:hypothetical protein
MRKKRREMERGWIGIMGRICWKKKILKKLVKKMGREEGRGGGRAGEGVRTKRGKTEEEENRDWNHGKNLLEKENIKKK